ncbi:hypothetical protein P8C59_005927 [Phyllachora maydis]|uniref:Alpha-ketoglutarate-dependent dioxygenase AlkB-like domain-containing protein n=1 Tax=Phyllachora maydis TaxID=1825666 RepID=A0AAD9MEZ8_9PEZI|nr:hypothetical protein P8C59_005927 [Phyllachora maydis]
MAVDNSHPPTKDPENPKIWRWDNGLTLIHDFITRGEEESLIGAFHAAEPREPPPPPATGGPPRRRRRKQAKRVSRHFGHHFDYTTFGASATRRTPVPACVAALLPRLPRARARPPDQFTMQHYPPGAGIPPHVDTHSLFDEALYSLSLGGDVPMLFRRCHAGDARRMRLPKRALQEEEGGAEGAGPGQDGGGDRMSNKRDLNNPPEFLASEAFVLQMAGTASCIMNGARY